MCSKYLIFDWAFFRSLRMSYRRCTDSLSIHRDCDHDGKWPRRNNTAIQTNVSVVISAQNGESAISKGGRGFSETKVHANSTTVPGQSAHSPALGFQIRDLLP